MDRKDLEKLSRAELVEKAEAAGVTRPRTLTMPELIDEILLASERSTGQKKPRGWFGRARDLLTSVVDRGLSTDPKKAQARAMPVAPPPLPTVTLAEIYAAQGHFERAIATLDEVIARDAAHDEARRLRDRFTEQLRRQRPSRPPQAEGLTAATLTPELASDPLGGPQSSSEDDKPTVRAALTPAALTPEMQASAEAAGTASPAPQAAAAQAAQPEPVGELADRYDVDEVVAIAVDPHTVYVYWEVRAATLAPLRIDHPEGALTLRVLIVPVGSVATTDARDVRVDAAIGELFVRDLPANAEIRVAIGWLGARANEASVFHPVAVGLELATPREAPAPEIAVQFGRASAGGEPFDGLRGGAWGGGDRGGSTFTRSTPEEISLGHAPLVRDLRAGVLPERDFSEAALHVERAADGAEIHTRVETHHLRVLGASEMLTRQTVERRFLGASEMGVKSPPRARPQDVSFAARPSR